MEKAEKSRLAARDPSTAVGMTAKYKDRAPRCPFFPWREQNIERKMYKFQRQAGSLSYEANSVIVDNLRMLTVAQASSL